MNKEELEKEISVLEARVEANKTMSENYVKDLAKTKKQLEDINKPELTSAQLDDIQCAVESAIENYSFSNCDNYETDFSLDYDGRVQLESIDLSCSYELIEMIVDKVHNLFKEVEDDDSQLNTHTVAEKII
tara:strand:- start:60 stop:452 length:393 start_codon:yes stop_codon:yes gene_type:complete